MGVQGRLLGRPITRILTFRPSRTSIWMERRQLERMFVYNLYPWLLGFCVRIYTRYDCSRARQALYSH